MTKKGLLSLIVLSLVWASCSYAMVATPTVTPNVSKTTPSLTAEQAWKTDWDRTVATAKEEGKLNIYTTYGPAETRALQQVFEPAYGVNLEFISGKGAEQRAKLFTERRAGLYLSDVFLMGGTSMFLELKPAGALDPLKPQLVLPEVVDRNAWYGGGHIYLNKEGTYVIGFSFSPLPGVLVNSDLVKPEDIKVHADLLRPRWKGKTVLNDPTTSGGGQEWFQILGL